MLYRWDVVPAQETRDRVAEGGRPKCWVGTRSLFPRGAHAYGLEKHTGAPLFDMGAELRALGSDML